MIQPHCGFSGAVPPPAQSSSAQPSSQPLRGGSPAPVFAVLQPQAATALEAGKSLAQMQAGSKRPATLAELQSLKPLGQQYWYSEILKEPQVQAAVAACIALGKKQAQSIYVQSVIANFEISIQIIDTFLALTTSGKIPNQEAENVEKAKADVIAGCAQLAAVAKDNWNTVVLPEGRGTGPYENVGLAAALYKRKLTGTINTVDTSLLVNQVSIPSEAVLLPEVNTYDWSAFADWFGQPTATTLRALFVDGVLASNTRGTTKPLESKVYQHVLQKIAKPLIQLSGVWQYMSQPVKLELIKFRDKMLKPQVAAYQAELAKIQAEVAILDAQVPALMAQVADPVSRYVAETQGAIEQQTLVAKALNDAAVFLSAAAAKRADEAAAAIATMQASAAMIKKQSSGSAGQMGSRLGTAGAAKMAAAKRAGAVARLEASEANRGKGRDILETLKKAQETKPGAQVDPKLAEEQAKNDAAGAKNGETQGKVVDQGAKIGDALDLITDPSVDTKDIEKQVETNTNNANNLNTPPPPPAKSSNAGLWIAAAIIAAKVLGG